MPPRLRKSNVSTSITPYQSLRPQCLSHPSQTSREFSQTSHQQATARRRKFYDWLNGPGAALKRPLPVTSTNYLGAYDKYGQLVRAPGWDRVKAQAAADAAALGKSAKQGGTPKPTKEGTEGGANPDELEQAVREDEAKKVEEDSALPPETADDLRPFPLNKNFRSQPVLSEELREAIYQRVARDNASVSLASVEFGVSNERVGAVVRLKQLEKEWVAEGKKLAVPYSKAVLNMVPTTPYVDPRLPENKGKRPVTHEAINDLIVHPATRQQLFVPVSESRHFTRVDAGKAFDNNLLPADDRIPHPELVLAEREIASGLSNHEREQLALKRIEGEKEAKKKEEEKKQREERSRRTVPGRRWDFVFQDVSVESAGKDGRAPGGVGWRYGFPHEDRKKGQVKIPTKVEA